MKIRFAQFAVLVALLAGAPGLAVAESFAVIWAEGTVERKAGNAWIPIAIGENVADNVQIKIGGDSYVQLANGGEKLTIAYAGVFVPSDFRKEINSTRKNEIIKKIDKIVGQVINPPKGRSVVGGVRGSAAGPDDELWMSSDSEIEWALESAFSLAGDGEWEQALAAFRALDVEDGDDYAGLKNYGLGFCSYMVGDLIGAIKSLRSSPPSESGSMRMAHTVLLVRLGLETGAAAEAEALVASELKSGFYTQEQADILKSLL